MSTTPSLRRDVAVTLVALAALLAWDFSGGDLATAHWFGNLHGFALRDTWWAGTLVHDGGRLAAWVLLAALVVAAVHAQAGARPGAKPGVSPGAAPSRAERWRWIGVILVCVLAVPALKRFSATSCPYELAEFGGVARYVSHWALGVRDGGPGHCFPSGHAVAAFAFFGLYFMWRGHDPRRARLWLAGVLGVGVLFGGAQLARGAHYPSHTLWSAWLCWVVSAVADAAFRLRQSKAP